MSRLDELPNLLRHLELAPDVPARQVDFFLSYAQMLERARTAGTQGEVWSRIASPAQEWLGSATLASTYRLAAQYAALVDMRRAAELTVRAALAYLDAGVPFGLFLIAGLLDERMLRDRYVFETLMDPFTEGTFRSAQSDPVQQTYLLLTAASRPWLRQLIRQPVDEMMNRLSAHDLHPIGPQSIPLASYLTMARTMLSDEAPESVARQGDDRAIDAMAGELAGLGRIQAASLRSTMRNRYLWLNGAAPVNVVDLEYVAIYGLAMRHNPSWYNELPRRISSTLENDDILAEIPVWAMQRIDSVLPDMADDLFRILRTEPPEQV